MKKFFVSGSLLLTAAMFTLLLTACQKDQTAAAATETTASGESNSISGVAGGAIPGLISRNDADQLRNEYLKSACGTKPTEYVAFSIKDLTEFLKTMKTKYQSDVVYINFGVYNQKTDPTADKSGVGRTTVFFTVNNKTKSTGNLIKENDDTDPNDPSNFLNHGSIYP